ncbi:MAG: hypothetical protein AAGU27_23390 [Dehalobacterium sp.]
MNNEFAGMSFALVILILVTIVAVILIWQLFKSWQIKMASRAEIARDEAYRKLAEEAVSVQKKIGEDLSDLRTRIESIEKILREVE